MTRRKTSKLDWPKVLRDYGLPDEEELDRLSQGDEPEDDPEQPSRFSEFDQYGGEFQ